MTDHNYLLNALVFLVAAIIFVPVSKKLGLGSVIGYLIGGVAIGPFVLSFIKDGESILHFSEFGVVLLLFLIGLELNPSRLWSMRREIFGLGGSQVVFTALILGITGAIAGLDWRLCVVGASGLALSSTAIALQTLEERNLMNSATGQQGFAVLLFQDIVVIPMIALLPLLATANSAFSGVSPWQQALKAIAAIAVVIFGGHYILTPVLKRIAKLQMREMFTAFSLALVIGIAQLMDYVGLSMALGTFLAGVLLADSEYRHELEIDIEPFKGLLMGLFFIAVGMSINFTLLYQQFIPVLLITTCLVLVKASVLYFLGTKIKLVPRDRLRFAAVLAQGGEFGFVLFEMASASHVISHEMKSILILSVVLSMITTPLLINLSEYIIRKKTVETSPEDETIESDESQILICGYGRFGQVIGRLLMSMGFTTTLLDSDPNQIELVRKFGPKVFFGDASRLDLLRAAGIDQAKAVILAMNDQQTVTNLTHIIRKHWPDILILARARNRQHAIDLTRAGANAISRETFGSSLDLAGSALHLLGFSKHRAWRATQQFKQYDERFLAEQSLLENDEGSLIQLAYRSRRDLELIYQKDQETFDEKENDWSG